MKNRLKNKCTPLKNSIRVADESIPDNSVIDSDTTQDGIDANIHRYKCNLCNYSNNNVTNYKKHLSTQKHLRNDQKKKLEIPIETNSTATATANEEADTNGNENAKNDIINDFFIFAQDDCLSKDVCNCIIDKFLKDTRRSDGSTLSGINKNVKNTTDLYITPLYDWKDVDNHLYSRIGLFLTNYVNYIRDSDEDYIDIAGSVFQNAEDFGYQIQEYIKNEGHYTWHTDIRNVINHQLIHQRLITFIIYLNDVHTGGETEFGNGQLITPKTGKILFFPATWTYKHRGKMPISNNKYIITGWVGHNILQ